MSFEEITKQFSDRLNQVKTKGDFLQLWEDAGKLEDIRISSYMLEMLASSGYGKWVPQ